jgi:hypothetical protein
LGVALPHSPVQLFTWMPLLQAFLSTGILGEVVPLLPSPACLFIYSSPDGLPPPLSALFAICLFFFSCLFIIQFGFFLFFIFPLVWGQYVQGAMLIWPRVVCGSTTCCLAHLVVC